MTPPKNHAWLRRPGEQTAHAVMHGQRAAVCGETSSSWSQDVAGAIRHVGCVEKTRRGGPNQLPPNTRPSKPIGGERRDILDALVLADGAGGVLGSVIDHDTRAWLYRHQFARPASVVVPPEAARWKITQVGRVAAEHGFY